MVDINDALKRLQHASVIRPDLEKDLKEACDYYESNPQNLVGKEVSLHLGTTPKNEKDVVNLIRTIRFSYGL